MQKENKISLKNYNSFGVDVISSNFNIANSEKEIILHRLKNSWMYLNILFSLFFYNKDKKSLFPKLETGLKILL